MWNHWPIDMDVFHAINGLAGRPTLDAFVLTLTRNSLVRDVLLIVPYVALWVRLPSEQARTKVVAGLVGGICAVIIARVLATALPFEIRPMYDQASGFVPLTSTVPLDMEGWSAFPSDTAAFSMALCLGTFALDRLLSVLLAVTAFIVFCVPRIYAGIHYPSDILAGTVIGAVAAAITASPRLARVWGALLHFEAVHRTWFYAASFVVVAELSQMFDGARGILHLVKAVL